MRYKRIALEDIIAFLGPNLLYVLGTSHGKSIDNIADASRTNESTLDWIKNDKSNKQSLAENSPAKVLLVNESVVYSECIKASDKTLLVVANPKIALAQIGNHFFVEKLLPGVDTTAQIAPGAFIGKNVYIGPNSVIGNATVGDNCRIDANVRIHDNVIMGTNCEVKGGAVLGGSGFGYEKDEHGNLFRFPQIGGLIIGNNVEIGSNTTIDRGALSDTVIGDYTKINNLCHIAHNNQIGKNVIITGCVNISGSNIIKDNVWIAPNSCIRGWIEIGQNAVIGAGAVVTKNIPAGETWVGNPARKLLK